MPEDFLNSFYSLFLSDLPKTVANMLWEYALDLDNADWLHNEWHTYSIIGTGICVTSFLTKLDS